MNIFQTVLVSSAVIMVILVLIQTRGASLGAGFGGSGELYTQRRELIFNHDSRCNSFCWEYRDEHFTWLKSRTCEFGVCVKPSASNSSFKVHLARSFSIGV